MIRSGPILASLVAAGIVLPTVGSSPPALGSPRGPCLQWAPAGAATVVWYTDPSFILAPELPLLRAEKGSCS